MAQGGQAQLNYRVAGTPRPAFHLMADVLHSSPVLLLFVWGSPCCCPFVFLGGPSSLQVCALQPAGHGLQGKLPGCPRGRRGTQTWALVQEWPHDSKGSFLGPLNRRIVLALKSAPPRGCSFLLGSGQSRRGRSRLEHPGCLGTGEAEGGRKANQADPTGGAIPRREPINPIPAMV